MLGACPCKCVTVCTVFAMNLYQFACKIHTYVRKLAENVWHFIYFICTNTFSGLNISIKQKSMNSYFVTNVMKENPKNPISIQMITFYRNTKAPSVRPNVGEKRNSDITIITNRKVCHSPLNVRTRDLLIPSFVNTHKFNDAYKIRKSFLKPLECSQIIACLFIKCCAISSCLIQKNGTLFIFVSLFTCLPIFDSKITVNDFRFANSLNFLSHFCI